MQPIILTAGQLEIFFENGFLRCIKQNDTEIVRMIYFAIRDMNWRTIPLRIKDLQQEQSSDSFTISYTAVNYINDADIFKWDVSIAGKATNRIEFLIKGTCLEDFKKNRVGLCLLHPIAETIGKRVIVLHPDGSRTEGLFPVFIEPDQPFKDISQMQWQLTNGNWAKAILEGDVFEMEDQRNWTDASFKTYSTPLALSFPVAIKTGDTIEQRITLCVDKLNDTFNKVEKDNPAITITDTKLPFPKIGYEKSSAGNKLTEQEITLLRQILFNHYRVKIRFNKEWKLYLKEAVEEALLLKTQLELIVFFSNDEKELSSLLNELNKYKESIACILVLHTSYKTTPSALWNQIYQPIKAILPQVQIGAGTDFYFAEWNREYLVNDELDFVSYSINPQVHASDTRSLIENLEAQQHTVNKAEFINPGKAIHISPVTLKPRVSPYRKSVSADDLLVSYDERQSMPFTAAWTLLSIRYLAKAFRITYFETKGKTGLMERETFPVYNYLKILHDFNPVFIRDVIAASPLEVDALVVENKKGELMSFIINFTEQEIKVTIDKAKSIVLNQGLITFFKD